MSRVVGLRLRQASPIAYADAGDLEMRANNYVVVRAEIGLEFGWVVRESRTLVWAQPEDEPQMTVIRKATSSDFGAWQLIKEMEQDGFKLARSKARDLQLKMKIVETHYTFDRSRLTVTFGA